MRSPSRDNQHDPESQQSGPKRSHWRLRIIFLIDVPIDMVTTQRALVVRSAIAFRTIRDSNSTEYGFWISSKP